ncbi:MAG: hypothetical protein COT18_05975 [Elusimicrobia bacterium CG08_land_8_20_14_0_20_59_10]|nr:MAG: hypothetical protein COT18_05975 [Elusimicrobia bacterium CG08_land_8_20_14_0_20_59_10]
MNKKLVVWLGILALLAAPVTGLKAQGGPGEEDSEEVEIWESGPGQSERPGMGGGMRGPRGAAMEEDDSEAGPRRMNVMVKKIRRGGQDEGGPFTWNARASRDGDILEIIGKHDPVFAEKLKKLKSAAPARYRIAMQLSRKLLLNPRVAEDEALEKDAVRGLSLELDVKELSRKHEKAADSEKASVKAELKNKLSELFDLKNKAQELRLKHMAGEVAKLQKKLAARKANKAKIVEQRVDQLTGEGIGW